MMEITCSYCKREIEISFNETKRKPEAGNLILCSWCGNFLIFGELLECRKLTLMELIDLQTGINWPVLEIMAINQRIQNGIWME